MGESVVRTADLKDRQGVQCVMETTTLASSSADPAAIDAAAKAGLARGTKVNTKLAKVGQALGKALTSELMSGQATHSRQLAKWQQEYQGLMSRKQDKFEEPEPAEAILAEADSILEEISGLFPSIAGAPKKAAAKEKAAPKPAPKRKSEDEGGEGKALKAIKAD
eukprot:5861204-Amphidinium_carterae.1